MKLTKVCGFCKLEKSLDQFYKRGDSDGYRSDCKDCYSHKNHQRWLKQPDFRERGKTRTRKYLLKNYYGMSLKDYDKLLESQNGACRICGQYPSEVSLAVDHCHETGIIRGLLCNTCNTGLGMFKDSKDLLRKAIDYLDDN